MSAKQTLIKTNPRGKVRGHLQNGTAGAGRWESAADFAIGFSSAAWNQAVQVQHTLTSSHRHPAATK